MYAVIETGGKQYRVEVGTELEVEHLDVEPGQAITLDRVLLVADGTVAAIGRPLVAEALVSAEVVRQARGEKLIVFKYRPKARSRVKKGHRQELTVLRITDVRLGDRSAVEDARAAAADAKTQRERLHEAATRQAAADAELAARLAAQTPAADPTTSASKTRGGSSGTAAAPAKKATPAKPAAKPAPKPAPKATAKGTGTGAAANAAPAKSKVQAPPKTPAKAPAKTSAKTSAKADASARPKSEPGPAAAPKPRTKKES